MPLRPTEKQKRELLGKWFLKRLEWRASQFHDPVMPDRIWRWLEDEADEKRAPGSDALGWIVKVIEDGTWPTAEKCAEADASAL